MDGELGTIKELSPIIFGTMVLAPPVVKYIITGLRRLIPRLDGGWVQITAIGLGIIVVAVLSLEGGLMDDGLSWKEGLGLLLGGAYVGAGAIAYNEGERKVAEKLKDGKESP